MLAIRMQRTGRKGHAMFRMVVQDARRTPSSGKVVAQLGSYDPHAKTVQVNKEKASFYLEHGAQPSERAARLLKDEGVKLPKWAQVSASKERAVRNPDKRRSTAPAAPEVPAEEAAPEAPVAAEPENTETPAAETSETPAEAPETAEPAAEAAEAAPADTEPADDSTTSDE